MKINIVAKPGWILERLAREIIDRVPDVTLNAGALLPGERGADPFADVNYYLPAKDLRKYPVDGHAIGFYTHGENAFDLIPRFDACVAMNRTMARALEARGAAHVTIIRPGTDAPPRPVVFGVIGRVYNDGRKGEALVAAAVADGFRFVACGFRGRRARAMKRHQWPCPMPYTIAERDAFYAAIDYLVVTSTEEGGPMPVLEAIARGVPVIAPNVGWCWEFPVLRYAIGYYAAPPHVGALEPPPLRQVLEQLTAPPSWQHWGEAHARLFAELSRKVA
jgi:glycosyltransferase involved in cell wall biosynthesis